MTVESLLLTALSIVSGWLVYMAKLLWDRSVQCERDRAEMREEIEALKEANGMANGTLKAFTLCPAPTCPFKVKTVTNICIFLAISIAFSACAHQSPGAKVSTVINVSLTSPTTVPL